MVVQKSPFEDGRSGSRQSHGPRSQWPLAAPWGGAQGQAVAPGGHQFTMLTSNKKADFSEPQFPQIERIRLSQAVVKIKDRGKNVHMARDALVHGCDARRLLGGAGWPSLCRVWADGLCSKLCVPLCVSRVREDWCDDS